MKNLKQIFGLAVLLAFFSFQNQLKAQATCTSYQITNNTSCAIVIEFTYICTTPPQACAQSPSGGISINPGQTLNINGCGNCTACDISVTLRSVNGSNTSLPVTVSGSNGTGVYSSALCPSNGTITWTSSLTTVD